MRMQVNAFKRTDEEFYKAVHREQEPERDAGTTALAALVAGDALLVANAGDCRAVLCRRGRAIDLSRDHNGKSEAARVEAAGEIQCIVSPVKAAVGHALLAGLYTEGVFHQTLTVCLL